MISLQHPNLIDSFVQAIRKLGRRCNYYKNNGLIHLISQLPNSGIPKLEAVLTELPEQLVDCIVGPFAELKSRSLGEPAR